MIKLLGWSHGLEFWLTLLAGAWGASALAFPDWWNTLWSQAEGWPLSPRSIAMVLITSSVGGFVSLWRGWRWMRMQSSILAFVAWGMLAVYDVRIPPVSMTQSAVTHSLLSLAELCVYVRILIGLDQRGNQLGSIVRGAGESKGE